MSEKNSAHLWVFVLTFVNDRLQEWKEGNQVGNKERRKVTVRTADIELYITVIESYTCTTCEVCTCTCVFPGPALVWSAPGLVLGWNWSSLV